MALPNFTEPKAGMSSAYSRPTPPVGSSDHADLKAMALGIQAWLDGTTDVKRDRLPVGRRTKPKASRKKSVSHVS